MTESWTGRYLGLLDLPRSAPDRASLDAIIRAHRAIAFENVSSLIRRHRAGAGPVPSLDLDAIMDTWVAHGGGGVCYEVGSMLGRLLDELGYVVYPVLAQISFPGSHSALMVELEGRQLLVDVGNGQPIFEAIPTDEPFEIDRAGLRYGFRVDLETGKFVQERWVDGGYKTFVTYEMTAATPDEMEASLQRHHAIPPMTFVMQTFRLVHCTEDVVIQLRDHDFTCYTAAGKATEHVNDLARYRELLAGPFGFPTMDVELGLAAWSAITGGRIED